MEDNGISKRKLSAVHETKGFGAFLTQGGRKLLTFFVLPCKSNTRKEAREEQGERLRRNSGSKSNDEARVC